MVVLLSERGILDLVDSYNETRIVAADWRLWEDHSSRYPITTTHYQLLA